MFLRKYGIPLSVFIVAIAGVGIYLLVIQPPPEPVKIYKAVEPLAKQKEEPTAEVPIGEETPEPQPNEPVVADENFHAEPHGAPVDRSMDAIGLSKLSAKEYEQAVIQFYHQAGVDPPPKGFEYLWEAPWVVERDESGVPILHKIGEPVIDIFYIKVSPLHQSSTGVIKT